MSRKNPVAAIQAFRSAFGESGDALLLVKVSQGEDYPDRLVKIVHALQGAPNIRLIQDTLTDDDTWKLLHSVDAILSLHRSEGFGLVPAQGMAIGKLAIATGWSGNMDYMTPENSLPVDYSLIPVEDPEGNYHADSRLNWADPDVGHAAALLRQAATNPDMRKRIGATAVATMQTKFGRNAVTRVIRNHLGDLGVTPGVK